jgi:hypothetical protein
MSLLVAYWPKGTVQEDSLPASAGPVERDATAGVWATMAVRSLFHVEH